MVPSQEIYTHSGLLCRYRNRILIFFNFFQFDDKYKIIYLQEVVVRGEPYCMLSLSADEIISKLEKPPPLIRPSVSKGAAPPEAINIMRQCWAETPEMRPDFNSYVFIITKRTKELGFS